jgi:putative pyruvate formate lyase activating enzyme
MENKRAREALQKYFGILEEKSKPISKYCKSTAVNVSLDESTDVLWEEHEKALKRFQFEEGKTLAGENTLLDLKVELANRIFKKCVFCERRCEADRTIKPGSCGVGKAKISSMFQHHGEESELVPSYTVFFSGCNFHCQFCQNYDISQRQTGLELGAHELAFRLEEIRARNLNWVGGSPTPNLNFILEVLNRYRGNLPSVWNSNMYMSVESMKLLQGTQDIFLTDFKYGNDECAKRLSKVENYTSIVRRNHLLAKEQSELIVRHLVLPNHIECCTTEVGNFVGEKLGINTRFNLMFQYRPMFKAHRYSEINRPLNNHEVSRALKAVKGAGLNNVII